MIVLRPGACTSRNRASRAPLRCFASLSTSGRFPVRRWLSPIVAPWWPPRDSADSPSIQPRLKSRPNTVFDLASVTKVVATTATAMLLQERGLLQSGFSRGFRPSRIRFARTARPQRADREAVTVRMLLAHSSGLPAYIKLFEFAHTRDELIHVGYGDSVGGSARLEGRLQ